MKKYPYSLVGKIVCISSALEEKEMLQGQKNPLKEMFPWIELCKKQDLSNYTIQGSKYQQNQPFYLHFNLMHSELANFSSLKNQIDNLLKILTERKREKNDYKQDLIKMKKSIPRLDFLNTNNGYIFTGIAKSSITCHEIFDTLFHTCHPNSESQKQIKMNEEGRYQLQDEDSNCSSMGQKCDIEGHRQVSNQIKLSWDFRYTSYEYFRFMNRSYRELKQRYEKRELLPQQVQEAVSLEMFPYNKARKFKYFEGQVPRQLDQRQYFDYFFELFKLHSQEIHQKLQANKQSENISYNLSYNLQIYHQIHQIKQFDFQAYLANSLKNINVSYQAFQNMILHNKKRYNNIINNFPLKTRQQRVQLLKQLVNDNTQIGNKIFLIELSGDFKESKEYDQFLIIQACQEQKDASKVCMLKQIRDVIIQQTNKSFANASVSKTIVKFNFRLQIVFIDIFHYFFYQQEYKPFRYITYDPQYLQYSSSQIITPLFTQAIEKMLDFNKLPKTAEQQILISTPNFEINIYQKLQYILQVYREAQQKDKLTIFCHQLTGEYGKLTLAHQQQSIEDQNSLLQSSIIGLFGSVQLPALFCNGFTISMQNIRLRLLQLALIKYEIHEQKKVFVYDSESNQAYNSSKLDHHKKIQSILTVLMIKIGIINRINYIAQDDKASQQLIKKYFQIQNGFIEFLETLMPLKPKSQKYQILGNDYRTPMPLSRYFQPVYQHHLLFVLRSKLYWQIILSNNMSEIEVLFLSEVHRIVLIKELQRMNNFKYNFEDKKIIDFFQTISDFLIKKSKTSSHQVNDEKDIIKLQINESIRNKMKPFKAQIKKLQQFYIQYQSISKRIQKQHKQKKQNPNNNQRVNGEKMDFLKNFEQYTRNIKNLELKCQKIYWQLFSNLYDKISKYENSIPNLIFYYNILLYFSCSSKKFPIRQLFNNPQTLKWTAQQLQKKIFLLKNLIIEMILQQKI